jgi:ABC-type bacteriocin/lantibiotic exporter with double-glycine peptidase domain
MNVPHFEQELDYSCLPACVRMVLAYHGHPVTEAQLRRLFKTRPGGTSPASVMLRLPDLGFTADVRTGARPHLQRHLTAGHPCIVHVWTPPFPHWTEQVIHALVITELAPETVTFHDPALPKGPTVVTLDAFLQAWAATNYLTMVIYPRSEV